jgi:preprotein translocase subunit SecF
MHVDSELIWTIVSFLVTLMVFSYLFGDNPLFRFVSALFIGVTAGYFAVVIVYQVLIARLVVPVIQGSTLSLVPLLLSGLLLTKLLPA